MLVWPQLPLPEDDWFDEDISEEELLRDYAE